MKNIQDGYWLQLQLTNGREQSKRKGKEISANIWYLHTGERERENANLWIPGIWHHHHHLSSFLITIFHNLA